MDDPDLSFAVNEGLALSDINDMLHDVNDICHMT